MTNHPAPEPAAPASAAPVPATDHVEPPFSARVIDALFAARKQRVDGWSPARVMAFIEILSETGSVTRAADYVDMSVTSAYRLRARPDCASFAEA